MPEFIDTEITIRSKDGKEGKIKDLPAPVMQALYYQITGKRESMAHLFRGPYIITKDSVTDLSIRLQQVLLV